MPPVSLSLKHIITLLYAQHIPPLELPPRSKWWCAKCAGGFPAPALLDVCVLSSLCSLAPVRIIYLGIHMCTHTPLIHIGRTKSPAKTIGHDITITPHPPPPYIVHLLLFLPAVLCLGRSPPVLLLLLAAWLNDSHCTSFICSHTHIPHACMHTNIYIYTHKHRCFAGGAAPESSHSSQRVRPVVQYVCRNIYLVLIAHLHTPPATVYGRLHLHLIHIIIRPSNNTINH